MRWMVYCECADMIKECALLLIDNASYGQPEGDYCCLSIICYDGTAIAY